MPERSTPIPELTPDGPTTVNGSVSHVDPSAPTILLGDPVAPAVDAAAVTAEVQPSEPAAEVQPSEPAAEVQPSEPAADVQPKHRSVVLEAQKLATGTVRVLERRGARSTVLGIALVAIGVALGSTSAVAVAMLVVGVVMLIVGLLGRRVQGRFAIEFGADGASIELQAHIASPGYTQLLAPLAPWKPGCAPLTQEPVRPPE
jgi:hypothetical protein